MNPVILEAAVVGAKEAAKLAVVWIVFSSYLIANGRERLIRGFYLGVALASGLVALSFFLPPSIAVKGFLSKLIGYIFFLLFLGSIAALYQESGMRLFGQMRWNETVLATVAVGLTILYLAPDVIGASMFVREMSIMREASFPVYASSGAGFAIVFLLLVLALRRTTIRLGRFFGLSQLLLFLAVVKLLGGGTKGFSEMSLIPSVQSGVMKFLHDAVHQTLLLLMVPDHPLLSLTAWNFIGIFFGANLALWAVLAMLMAPPAMFLWHSYASPLEAPPWAETKSERRLLMAAERADRRRKAIPIVLFMVVILVSWFSGRVEDISRLYNPRPNPVVEERGIIVVPLTDPGNDVRDGSLHKFVFSRGNESIVFMVIKRPDGKLAVVLDACEICPPEGYGLSGENVVCIYCMTPIAIDTLGMPGGCNPIPLDATVTKDEIVIETSHLLKKWESVKAGRAKEVLR